MRNGIAACAAYVVFGAVVLLGLPVLALVALVTWPVDRNRVIAGRTLRLIARLCSSSYPAWRMELQNVTRPPRGEPFIVVANHESILDVFLISRLPWEMKWMAKASLFRLPFVGQMLHLAGDIPVTRGDSESGSRALARARAYLRRGMPVMVFPEGTRSRDGRVLPFKAGAFKLAIETGATILPVAVHGAAEGMPVDSPWIRPAHAVARMLRPVPTRGLTLDDLPALMASVRGEIQAGRDRLAREALAERELEPRRAPATPVERMS